MYTGVVITAGRCAQLMAGSGDGCEGNSLIKMSYHETMDYPEGCFFTDYIFIGEGNQTEKKVSH